MWLLDVNLLLYAHKRDLPGHPEVAAWLEAAVATGKPFAVSSAVLSGFVRVATDPKIFKPPSTLRRPSHSP